MAETAEYTFVGDVLAGRTTEQSVDSYVDAWHDCPPGVYPATVRLHVFLGMHWLEFARWCVFPGDLPIIIERHRRG